MNKLLPTARKRAIGFIIIDASAGTPLALSGSGLLRPSAEPSFFRITPRENSKSRRKPNDLGYRYAHRKAEYAITRHHRILGRYQTHYSDWAITKSAAALKPIIKTLYST